MFRRFFSNEVTDRLTGRTFLKALWPMEVANRDLVRMVRKFGPLGFPDETLLGAQDPDHSGSRGEIAYWMTEAWAYESYGFDPDDLDSRVLGPGSPGWDASDLIVDNMDDGDLILLLASMPDDPADPSLPDRRSVRSAIEAVPPDPDSLARHEWRFNTRHAALQEGRERLLRSARKEQGGSTGPLTDFSEEFFGEVDAGFEAGYCGDPECAHCAKPATS